MNTDDSLNRLISTAADEDLNAGTDLSAELLAAPDRIVSARVTLRRPGVPCGQHIATAICAHFAERLNRRLSFEPTADFAAETPIERPSGTVLGTLHGEHAAILTAERTVLNFLTRLSGIAALTHRFVRSASAANPHVRICDTRKTIPGWRALDKYAVRCGGGHNHRFGLYDAVLIKDNHIAGIAPADLAQHLRHMLDKLPTTPRPEFIEVEVDSLAQFDAVLTVPGIDIILLDNFTPADMREAVRRRAAHPSPNPVQLEASGNVTLESVAKIAATGIDRISIGALTHSAPALDIGLDF